MHTILIGPHLVEHASVDTVFAQMAVQIRRGLKDTWTPLHTALVWLLSGVDTKMVGIAGG